MILPIRKLPIIFNRVFNHCGFFTRKTNTNYIKCVLNPHGIRDILIGCVHVWVSSNEFVNYIDQASLHSIVGNVWTVKLELLEQKRLHSKTTCRHVNWFIWTFCSSCVENLKFSKQATKHAPESAEQKRLWSLLVLSSHF